MSEAETLGAFEVIADVDTFEAFLDVQTAIVPEARWHLDPEALRMAAVDAANACMVRASLPAASTEHYAADGGLLGVNLERLSEYIDTAPAGDVVHLDLDAETRKLAVERGPTDFTMSLIDPENIRKEPDRPDLDLPASFTVTGAVVSSAVKAAATVSDHLDIEADPDAGTVTVTASGDMDSVSTVFDDDDLIDADLGGEAVSSKFSVDYFEEIIGPMPDDAEVAFRVGPDYPTILNYDIGDGVIEVENLLAPRIQSD